MSNSYDDYTDDEYAVDNIPPKRRYIWLWVGVVVLMGYAAYEIVNHLLAQGSEPVYDVEVEEVACVDALLPGLYTVTKHFPSGDDVVFHAELCYDTVASLYKVLFVSGYSVSEHELTTAEGGKLFSPTLGEGILSYKEDIDRTTIIFNKENIQWVLKK